MTNEEAIQTLRRMQEPEAYEPQINEAAFEALQIAIEALKAQEGTDVNGDTIYRQAAIDAVSEACEEWRGIFARCKEKLLSLPSAQPEQDREFLKLTVRNSNGRPYYSIIYLEVDDNGIGHDFEGYSSYSLDVISDYLKKYFMSFAQPEPSQVARDIATIIENEQDMRVILSRSESEERTLTEDDYAYCANCDHVEMCRWYPMYGCEFRSKPSAQPEIVRCKDCKHWQSEGHIGNNNVHTLNIASLPCKNWLTGGDWYCGSAERRSDEQKKAGTEISKQTVNR